jgi:hypothetical protein
VGLEQLRGEPCRHRIAILDGGFPKAQERADLRPMFFATAPAPLVLDIHDRVERQLLGEEGDDAGWDIHAVLGKAAVEQETLEQHGKAEAGIVGTEGDDALAFRREQGKVLDHVV